MRVTSHNTADTDSFSANKALSLGLGTGSSEDAVESVAESTEVRLEGGTTKGRESRTIQTNGLTDAQIWTTSSPNKPAMPHSVMKPVEAIKNELLHQYGQHLVNYIANLNRYAQYVDKSMRLDASLLHSKSRKPQLDSRTFKAHTLDNLLVRRMCDEVLLLESPSFLPQHLAEIQRLSNGSGLYMPTLRANSGTTINRLNFIDNPSVTIGGPCLDAQTCCREMLILSLQLCLGDVLPLCFTGYFMLAQMLGMVQTLVSLELSHSMLNAGDLHVLAIGLKVCMLTMSRLY